MSKIEVDAIDKQSGSTLTLGGSGTAVTLACGATQSGFGRSGSVNWQTTPKTAASFTAVNGEGYFIDTSSNTVTANLPAGSAGAIVAFSDYARNFATNKLTISPNGSEKIGGIAAVLDLVVNGQALTLVYVDSTKGWINVQNAEDTKTGEPPFIAATGGTVLTNGNFKTHIFTGPGTFCVSSGGTPGGSNTVDYVVVAGGGASGSNNDGQLAGGGAGGFRVSNSVGCVPAPTMSPLVAPAALPVTAQGYPITIGGGGSNTTPIPGGSFFASGVNSTFSTITSAGGGGSGYIGVGGPGGSGGGGAQGPTPSSGYAGGAGNTPPVSPPQGQNGGTGYDGLSVSNTGGGGGGAGAVGGNASLSNGGTGGAGSFIADTVFGPTAPSYGTPGPVSSTRYFAGGGGGNTDSGQPAPSYGTGGAGGGGNAYNPSPGGATNGTVNTGGGSGGGAASGGGSGIVIIRYKFQ